MDLGIRGRVALIGASGRGIGLATTRRLSMEGCDIAICDKDDSVIGQAIDSVKEVGIGNRVCAYFADLSKQEDIVRMVASVKRDLGSVNILVTNSGGPLPGTFQDIDDET